MLLFFFSSRRRHTRFTSDWSSDVCSSDLRDVGVGYSADQVMSMPATPIDLLLEYHEACREQTLDYIANVDPLELDKRCPFEALHRQLPDITKGGVLAHIVVETSQHLGQIGYIRGILRGIDS